MTNTKAPVLHRGKPRGGVMTLLTPDAYDARRDLCKMYEECGSWERVDQEYYVGAPTLEARVMLGRFTFVDPDRYHKGYPGNRLVHTGDTNLLDYVQNVCTVEPFEAGVWIDTPFSNGDYSQIVDYLALGNGPRLAELMAVLYAAHNALAQNATAEMAKEYPDLLQH